MTDQQQFDHACFWLLATLEQNYDVTTFPEELCKGSLGETLKAVHDHISAVEWPNALALVAYDFELEDAMVLKDYPAALSYVIDVLAQRERDTQLDLVAS